MVLLPVVARELRVKARGKAAYRVRFWAVLLMLALLFWFLKFSGESQNAPNFGLDVMVTLSIPAGIFSLLIGVAATARTSPGPSRPPVRVQPVKPPASDWFTEALNRGKKL